MRCQAEIAHEQPPEMRAGYIAEDRPANQRLRQLLFDVALNFVRALSPKIYRR
jgi:hypothetical protein